MKNFFAALFAGAMAVASPALSWEVEDLNNHIEQTNFIVGNHCSGTLISLEHKLILTNDHCVQKYIRHKTEDFVGDDGIVTKKQVEYRDDVQVSQKFYNKHKLVSQNSYIGDIVDFDEKVDLALIQLRQDNLLQTREAKIFTGDEVFRGETVYAIGNPMMLDASVTKGIVSNVNRLIQVGREKLPYFQMDAGIVGGSSGGSLYNDEGELIGVPAAAARGTSVGLAIPYYAVQDFLTENCFQEVWDVEAVPYEECKAAEEAEAEEE